MRGSSVTERAWGVSGWARMREMRKREVLSRRIPNMHVHRRTLICDDTYPRTYMNLFMVMFTCTCLKCRHMHIMFTLSISFSPYRMSTHAHTHTHTQTSTQSVWRRGVGAVGTWFPSLHTHSSLSRGPDRALCPTGHGSTHTHKYTHTFNTHAWTERESKETSAALSSKTANRPETAHKHTCVIAHCQ